MKSRKVAQLFAVVTVVMSSACASTGPDPWEGMNRGLHSFNEGLDRYALEPAAKGWDAVFPDPAQVAMGNFFDNSRYTISIYNNLLQLKPIEFGQDVARFTVNTTVGIGGLFDVATMWKMPIHDEDFGLTLAHYGVKPGPFLMLPFFGPSNIRDTIGLAADSFSIPWTYLMPWWASTIRLGTRILNTRAKYLDVIAESRETSLDYYVFLRDAYVQNRRFKAGKVLDEESEDDLDYYEDDLYYYEDDLYYYEDEEDGGETSTPAP